MGTSSTQSTTNMKSKIQGRRKENVYETIFIIDKFSFVCL